MMRLIIAVCALTLAVQPLSAQPWHGHWGHGYDHPGGYGGFHNPNAFWGGVVGGAIGSLFFPREREVVVQQPPVVIVPEQRSVEWCMNRYRSYNPQTRVYFGFDGQFRACP